MRRREIHLKVIASDGPLRARANELDQTLIALDSALMRGDQINAPRLLARAAREAHAVRIMMLRTGLAGTSQIGRCEDLVRELEARARELPAPSIRRTAGRIISREIGGDGRPYLVQECDGKPVHHDEASFQEDAPAVGDVVVIEYNDARPWVIRQSHTAEQTHVHDIHRELSLVRTEAPETFPA